MRKGDWMTTFSGSKFWPLDPQPEDVNIEDIAHALSLLCRFGGHCKEFYSVAEHSVRCWRVLPALGCLLHDATEAYIGDLIRPIKPFVSQYKQIEQELATAIEAKFGIPAGYTSGDEVKHVDSLLLSTEHRDLIVDGLIWTADSIPPLPDKIAPWTCKEAEQRFLEAFNKSKL